MLFSRFGYFLSHLDHVIKGFETGLDTGVTGLGIIAQIQDRNLVIRTDIVQWTGTTSISGMHPKDFT